MNETGWTPQSRLLRALGTADETETNRLKDDLQALLSFLPTLADELLSCAIEAYLTHTSKEESEVVEKLVESRKLPPKQAVSALRVTAFLLRAFTPPRAPEDSVDTIATDLIHSQLSPPSSQEKIRQFLTSLEKATQEHRPRLLQRRVPLEGTALLQRVETAPVLAGVFDKRLQTGQSASEYDPLCENLVPLGIVKLRLEESSVPYVSFQADERTLNILIAELEALRKELRAMKTKYLSESD